MMLTRTQIFNRKNFFRIVVKLRAEDSSVIPAAESGMPVPYNCLGRLLCGHLVGCLNQPATILANDLFVFACVHAGLRVMPTPISSVFAPFRNFGVDTRKGYQQLTSQKSASTLRQKYFQTAICNLRRGELEARIRCCIGR